jgi:formylglycine-generating enzyme required for sulfatase activity
MNSLHPRVFAVLAIGLILPLPDFLRAEGPLTPPGAPTPTMKTLQEIWDKIGDLETQVAGLEAQNAVLENALKSVGGLVPLTIEMVTVDWPGLPPDFTGNPVPAGEVFDEYQIGKYEVNNAEYCQFLNAVAGEDTHGLYAINMGISARGGITQAGASPNFVYVVRPNMGNKPVNHVDWYDTVRFCNWLHNGQPTGPQDELSTEDGAYTLSGTASIGTGDDPTNGANGRNAGALFWLPSEDEWYKAAYHQPGASMNDYWLYPTRSDVAPTLATADLFGNIDNDTGNIANYGHGVSWNGQAGNVTAVGSGGIGSSSFYGAFDMGGNISEWTEQVIFVTNRVIRGGGWNSTVDRLGTMVRIDNPPTVKGDTFGFRVAGSY